MDDQKGNDDIDHGANVVDIDAEKKRRNKNKKADAEQQKEDTESCPKPSIAELQFTVIQAFNDKFEGAGLRRIMTPQQKFAIIQDKITAEKIIIELLPEGLCKIVPFASVADSFAKYVHSICLPAYTWGDHSIDSCTKLWLKLTPPIEEPAAYLFKDDEGLTYNRLPWNLHDNRKTPLWNDMCSRMNDPKTFRAFVWSIFVNESYDQQYLVIKGPGGDGKGSIAKILKRILGDGKCGTISRPSKGDDKHFGVPFYKRRLVCFTDLRDMSYFTSDVVMGITGGDDLQIEPKGGHVFNAPQFCKLMMFCQGKPEIPYEPAYLRRILMIQMQAMKGVTLAKTYIEDLWAETGAFLGQCKRDYEELCPNHEPIKQSQKALELIKSFAVKPKSPYEHLFDDKFIPHPRLGREHKEMPFIETGRLNEILEHMFPATLDECETLRTEFKRYMVEEKGAVAGRKYIGGIQERVYFGITSDFDPKADWTLS